MVLFYLLLVLKLNRIQTIMQKLNQQPDICPYFSPEFKVIPQYIIMKEGECMELNNRTTSFLFLFFQVKLQLVLSSTLIGPCWKMKCFFCLKTTVLNGKLLRKQC